MPGITLYTPAQCLGNTNFLPDDGDAGYSVFVKSSTQFPRVLPKLQYIYTQLPSTQNVGKIDFNLKQIGDENIRLLVPKKCIIDKKTFETYAKFIGDLGGFTMTKPQNSMSFKLAGMVPIKYNVGQGLSSLQITISNDSVYTDYTFEDLIVQPPSQDYFTQYLKDLSKGKTSMAGVQGMSNSTYKSIQASSISNT
jgi:hypothetical protein